MNQYTALEALLDYVDQVINIHESGPVLERYAHVRTVVEEYQEYRRYLVEGDPSSALESVTATAGGSPVQGSGQFQIH